MDEHTRKVVESLKGYSPAGTKVRIAFHRIDYTGKIVRQGGAGFGALFQIRLDKPVGFETHAENIGIDEEKKAALYEQMIADNCLDAQGRITCMWAYWRDVEVEPKRGTLVEYTEHDPDSVMAIATFPGRIVGIEGPIVLMELLWPLTFMRTPIAVVSQAIRPGFHSEEAHAIGVDTYNHWKRKSPDSLPPGKVSKDGWEYEFEQSQPAQVLKEYCEKYHKERDWQGFLGCIAQGLLMYIVPIGTEHKSFGAFRPLREDIVDYYAGAFEVEEIGEED